MKDFTNGETLKLENGDEIKVIDKLGSGGQGTVYSVDYKGNTYALKWYLDTYIKTLKSIDGFYKNLSDNISKGSPSPEFLWPLALTKKTNGSFGYIMELRPSNFVSFINILNAKFKFENVAVLATAGKNIAKAFQSLHRSGFSYQDINDGSFFVDTKTGDVLICDNDNVAPYGTSLGIAGKDRYMAPEVCLGKNAPDAKTDRYSLAVVLFMLVFNAHPLEGALVHKCPCLTPKYISEFYAKNPIFIYHPNKTENRPVRGVDSSVLALWPLFPMAIKNIFTKAFTTALDRNSRILETEWVAGFEELINDLVFCPKCNTESFYSMFESESNIICGDCGTKFNKPMIVRFKKFDFIVAHGKKLLAKQIQGSSDEEIALVMENKKVKGLYGLKNTSKVSWIATLPDGSKKTINSQEVLPVVKDIIIDFGCGVGEIRV